MNFIKRLSCILCASLSVFFSAGLSTAQADSLYQAPAYAPGPGHPLRLMNDHRATQIGDLVAVEFNYSANSSSATSNAQTKASKLDMNAGTGLAGIPLFNIPTTYGAGSSSSSTKAKSDTSSFTTTMMATVSEVLSSGALVITGDENVVIDGQKHICHVKGTIRPEDIDNTDTVLSSRISDVSATFDGDSKLDHHGIFQRVLDVLF